RSVARCAGSGFSWGSYPRFADSPGDSVLSPAARAPVFLGDRAPGSRTHRGIAFCRPLCGLRFFLGIVPPVRGLTGGYILSPAARAPVFLGDRTPGSRTHRGLHSVARCAGSGFSWGSYPRFEDSPGATFCRPLRGLRFFLGIVPPVRGLTGGYILSPAARAPVFLGDRTPRSRTHRGLRSGARCARSVFSLGSYAR